MINPAFLNYPEEEALVGQMLLGYSDIVISLLIVSGEAMKQKFVLLEATHKLQSESQRIRIASTMARGAIEKLGLEQDYSEAVSAVNYCKDIRNNYAHCLWGLQNGGLAYTSVEKDSFTHAMKDFIWYPVDKTLLEKQKLFFVYTKECLAHLESNITPLLVGKGRKLKMPNRKNRPRKHNSIHSI